MPINKANFFTVEILVLRSSGDCSVHWINKEGVSSSFSVGLLQIDAEGVIRRIADILRDERLVGLPALFRKTDDG